MKLLLNDTDSDVCKAAIAKLQAAGISCTLREPEPATLFDSKNQNRHEVWILNDADFEEAWKMLNADQPAEQTDDEPA
jgi:hypothetical protein